MPDPQPFTREALESAGFVGFLTVSQLRGGRIADVPDAGGVYEVLRGSEEPVKFLATNPGGRFKGRDPTVDVSLLKGRWVNGTQVIYIGKGDRLRRRLRKFIDFGSGKPIGHWGGRHTWQVEGSVDFTVGWKETPDVVPRQAEIELLSQFERTFGRLPLANLVG